MKPDFGATTAAKAYFLISTSAVLHRYVFLPLTGILYRPPFGGQDRRAISGVYFHECYDNAVKVLRLFMNLQFEFDRLHLWRSNGVR